MYESIRRTYLERIIPAFPIITVPDGIYPEKFTYDDFKDYFKKLPKKFHANLVLLIWKNENLLEEKKMELLIDVIRGTSTSNSLNAKYFAGNILAEKMGINWQPFDYRPINDAWNKRQGTTTTK